MFEIIGIITTLFLFFTIIMYGVEYERTEDYILFLFYSFGFIYTVKGSQVYHNLNQLRKTEGKRFFINAPEWFNKNVYNFGVKK